MNGEEMSSEDISEMKDSFDSEKNGIKIKYQD